MKTTFLLFLILLVGFAPLARAQYPFRSSPIPSPSKTKSQQIAKWTESIGVLNQQLQQLQQTLQVAQTVKGYIGDPAAAAQAMGLQLLGTAAESVRWPAYLQPSTRRWTVRRRWRIAARNFSVQST